MTSKCKLCLAEAGESDPTEGHQPDLYSCSGEDCVLAESWYSLDEWEKLNSDDNRRDLFKQVVLAGTMQINHPLVAIAWSWPLDKDSEIILSYIPIEGV